MRKVLNHYIKYTKGDVILIKNIYYVIIKNTYSDDEKIECFPLKINHKERVAEIIKELIILDNTEYDVLPIHIHEPKLNLIIQEVTKSNDVKSYLKELRN